jgi:hypothetical protein
LFLRPLPLAPIGGIMAHALDDPGQ